MLDLSYLVNFIESNQDKFYRIAFSYVKNREDALDIVYEAIVKALQKRETVRHAEYLSTWFYRILTNECLGFFRKNKKMIVSDAVGDLQEASSEEDREGVLDLYRALDLLPPKLKTVVILRFFEDMKLEQIAKITATNLSTVKSRLYKALHILRINMEDLEND